jgi:putative transposase
MLYEGGRHKVSLLLFGRYCQIEADTGELEGMKTHNLDYHGYRFPPELISYAVWLYHRFSLSFRDFEELLAEHGVTVSYEAIRLSLRRFGQAFAKRLRGRRGRPGDTWHLDEMFVAIVGGMRHYLWRAVDRDGEALDTLAQIRRDTRAAKRFFRKWFPVVVYRVFTGKDKS